MTKLYVCDQNVWFFDLAELPGPNMTVGPCLAFLYGLFCLKSRAKPTLITGQAAVGYQLS